MEARKILFVMNNSSSQKSIMSEAETLGALKADMRRAGINYDNMTFYEGRMMPQFCLLMFLLQLRAQPLPLLPMTWCSC